jgi:hypothetical protein
MMLMMRMKMMPTVVVVVVTTPTSATVLAEDCEDLRRRRRRRRLRWGVEGVPLSLELSSDECCVQMKWSCPLRFGLTRLSLSKSQFFPSSNQSSAYLSIFLHREQQQQQGSRGR